MIPRGARGTGPVGALLRENRGSVFILVAVFLMMLLFSLALVVDLGSVHYCRARLQDAADAAALAAAGKAREGDPAEGPVEAEALKYLEEYGLGSPEEFLLDPDAGTVTVTLAAEAPMYFGRIFGAEAVTLGAQACARWDSEGVSLAP